MLLYDKREVAHLAHWASAADLGRLPSLGEAAGARLARGAIAGLGMLIVGALLLTDSQVKCGSKVMQPGETCTATRKGITTERIYDEQRSYNHRIGMYTTAGGPVVLLVCGAGLVIAVRKRRARALASEQA